MSRVFIDSSNAAYSSGWASIHSRSFALKASYSAWPMVQLFEVGNWLVVRATYDNKFTNSFFISSSMVR